MKILNERYCICCSVRSIEGTQFDEVKNSNCFQEDGLLGLRCNRCGNIACSNCIKKILTKINPIRSDIHPVHNHYVECLQHFINYGSVTLNNSYIGHCCLVFSFLNDTANSSESGASSCSPHRYPRRNVRQKLENRSSLSNKINRTDYIPNVGGGFCLPEFNLIIATNTQCMDVFALGGEENILPRLHYVIDEKSGDDIASKGISPQMKIPSYWASTEAEVDIVPPHSTNGKKKRVSVNCIKMNVNF